MQTTLRIDDAIYRQAKAKAARLGITLTGFIEQALQEHIARRDAIDSARQEEIDERERLMEALLQATAHFRIGPKPTREEVNER
jgi:hypothetical protein